MGLILAVKARDDASGLSVTELKRLLDEAVAKTDPGVDLDTVYPKLSVTARGKVKKLEIEIP